MNKKAQTDLLKNIIIALIVLFVLIAIIVGLFHEKISVLVENFFGSIFRFG